MSITCVALERFALYTLSDIGSALGEATAPEIEEDDGFNGDPPRSFPVRGSSDSDQQAHLRRILEAGDAARWRALAKPAPSTLKALSALGARAPHMASLTTLVRQHVAAALTIGLPVALPPLLLIGEPGLGKTWVLSRMAAVLGIPFRRYAMSGQSLADGLCGSHPVWRSAGPGLVAKTLLSQPIANPLIFVDEVDKAASYQREDPYRAFYDLLEPENARAFSDEYLQFSLNASRVVWLLAANDAAPLPGPVLDRLTVVTVASPDEAQSRAVAASIYAEENAARRRFFPPTLDDGALERLVALNPRGIRKAIATAMTLAAARGSALIRADDIEPTEQPRTRIGFR